MIAQMNVQTPAPTAGMYQAPTPVPSRECPTVIESRRLVREGQRQEEAGAHIVSQMRDARNICCDKAATARRLFVNAIFSYTAAARVLRTALNDEILPGKRLFLESKLEYIVARRQSIQQSAAMIPSLMN